MEEGKEGTKERKKHEEQQKKLKREYQEETEEQEEDECVRLRLKFEGKMLVLTRLTCLYFQL